MRFSHLADVHIGAWYIPALRDMPSLLFDEAITLSLARKVDFILIAGDLFNSALPGVDHILAAVRSLNRAHDAGVPVYLIPGSHDFSPGGKSMLRVLEEAGLVRDVCKGEVVDGKLRLAITVDPRTGVMITGMLGRKGMLERQHYEDLDRQWLENQVSGESVFLFHTSLDELKPSSLSAMSSSPVSMLPKGFSYYAGGHVHVVEEVSLPGYAHVVYPGPVCPASFSELEKLKSGSMVFFDNGKVERVPLLCKEVRSISLHLSDSPENITQTVMDSLADINDKIVLVRLTGHVVGGRASDVDFKRIAKAAQGCHVLLRNTVGLLDESAEKREVAGGSAVEIEKTIFESHANSTHNPFGQGEVARMQQLLRVLSAPKRDGETNTTYDDRVLGDALKVLGLDQ